MTFACLGRLRPLSIAAAGLLMAVMLLAIDNNPRMPPMGEATVARLAHGP